MKRRTLERKTREIQKAKRNKHDNLITKMRNRLVAGGVEYDSIRRNIEYGPMGVRIGEMDLVAIKGNRMLIFEMKSNYSENAYEKGKEQLKRSREFFGKHYDVYSFFISPTHGKRQ